MSTRELYSQHNPLLPSIIRNSYIPGTHLLDFLGNTSKRSRRGTIGTYVNQGTYGIGLQYKILDDHESPFSYMTLSSMERQIPVDNKSVFIKLVPLTQEIPEDEYDAVKDRYLTQYYDFLLYLNAKGDIKQHELREPDPSEHVPSQQIPVSDGYINYSDFRGFDWYLSGRIGKPEIESTYIHNFIAEIESQIQIFRLTNGDLSSFVLPIYESIIVDQDNLHIINAMEANFSRTDLNQINPTFFDDIRKALTMNKYFKLGVIVMPMMAIPPMTPGWITLLHLGLYSDHSFKELAFEYISQKNGNDYLLHDSDNTGITPDQRKGIFIITQMVYYMIKLLELGKVHGDVHPGNILIHPKLPNTTQCFKEGTMDLDSDKSHYLSTVVLLDFGTVRENSRVISETEPFKRFIQMIKILLTTTGSHNFSPLQSGIYDWFVALFLKRNRYGKKVLFNEYEKTIDYDTLVSLKHDEYFVNENFERLFRMIERFKLGNAEYIMECYSKLNENPENKAHIRRIQQFNSSGNLRRTVLGGNGEQMDLMVENLYNGEKSLQMLKEQYHEEKDHKIRISKSHKKQVKSRSRKGRKPSLSSFFGIKKKQRTHKKNKKARGRTRSRRIRSRSVVY
jgi:serine/threonine protein kinase